MPFNATSSPGPSPRSKWWSEKPLLKYSKNRGVFCHVTHDEMAFCRRLFPASGGPVCFLQSETLIQTKRRHFTTIIVNEEKALGTMLHLTSFIILQNHLTSQIQQR